MRTLTKILALLKPGRNVMAAHCRNTGGGAVIDFALVRKHNDVRFDNPAVQKSVNVLPTRTIYELTCGPVDLELTFAAPLYNPDLCKGLLKHIFYYSESGNMIILTAAIAAFEGNADYAAEHKEVLKLCTDDFAGHFAHNANISVKAILGVASYAKIAGMLGDKEASEAYFAKAREMAAAWKEMAFQARSVVGGLLFSGGRLSFSAGEDCICAGQGQLLGH